MQAVTEQGRTVVTLKAELEAEKAKSAAATEKAQKEFDAFLQHTTELGQKQKGQITEAEKQRDAAEARAKALQASVQDLQAKQQQLREQLHESQESNKALEATHAVLLEVRQQLMAANEELQARLQVRSVCLAASRARGEPSRRSLYPPPVSC